MGAAETADGTLWAALEPLGSNQQVRRHSTIHSPNQPATSLYLLVSGQVGLQMVASSGRVLTLRVIEPGQIFGYSVIETSSTYDTHAVALSAVRLIAVPQIAVRERLQREPHLSMAMIDLIGQHRLAISRRIDEVAFKSVPARLASVLLEMSETQPQQRVPRHTHQQLAEMINAYRETVTKVINQFRDARLLDVDRSGITLLNPSRLRELSQS
ncbi:Crp/Fnr family transcriptional regulator [Candidatus Oscillochloris fontis]|uniref:Crp/Fnr family transcriptional regulator n=1 Tax=Candidatus Oscillochloris fontis TaxID=2496868 RepID=UPI00101C0F28|nr:Crp/Fnr family transcriptional regulator [Candidatus Oscillochloris fontis]